MPAGSVARLRLHLPALSSHVRRDDGPGSLDRNSLERGTAVERVRRWRRDPGEPPLELLVQLGACELERQMRDSLPSCEAVSALPEEYQEPCRGGLRDPKTSAQLHSGIKRPAGWQTYSMARLSCSGHDRKIRGQSELYVERREGDSAGGGRGIPQSPLRYGKRPTRPTLPLSPTGLTYAQAIAIWRICRLTIWITAHLQAASRPRRLQSVRLHGDGQRRHRMHQSSGFAVPARSAKRASLPLCLQRACTPFILP